MSLRDALREGTRGAHDALDARMSALDLDISSDLRVFLEISASGWAGIGPVGMAQGTLDEMRAALALDLTALGGAPAMPAAHPVRHPLAGAYLVLGSRLGLGLLARRFAAARPRAYLGLAPCGPLWRALCAELAAMPAEGAEARAVIGDAAAHFETWTGLAAMRLEEVADVA